VQKFTAGVLDSGILRNDGKGHFTFEPLPWEAQLTPSFGVAISELNGDGSPDVVLAQNFFTPQIETGRMASGLSLLLTGNGKGGLNAVWPNKSGINESGDAKSLSIADVDGDGRPDVVMGLNDSPMSVFLARGAAAPNDNIGVPLARARTAPSTVGHPDRPRAARRRAHMSSGSTLEPARGPGSMVPLCTPAARPSWAQGVCMAVGRLIQTSGAGSRAPNAAPHLLLRRPAKIVVTLGPGHRPHCCECWCNASTIKLAIAVMAAKSPD